MAEFATADDIARGRRPLTPDEKLDVEEMIAAASQWIQDRRAENGKPELPDGDPAAKQVVVQVVRTAFDRAEHAGLSSYSWTVGATSGSGTLANPGELLVFTDFHRQLLGLPLTARPAFTFGD
ncbi:hypothetical protein GS876_10355 [Rhodococcus hoagii]|nr:hypothetical protein [Prescottella equi]NKT31586.1 hypothetical protein [Prescottella equi]NKT39262.1 hypothetical protein [Prescottella equi]NKT72939.1 hypothetical protein [Prescottella equi]NKT72947.1 hypothetical protein [Prescottella equi]